LVKKQLVAVKSMGVLASFICLFLFSDCKSHSYEKNTLRNAPLMSFYDKASYSFIFDVYDPISYKVSRYDSNYIVTIFTHKSKNGRLFKREYLISSDQVTDPISLAEIANIPSCSDNIEYVCQGLGGSEIWIRYYPSSKKYIVSKYWSPEDQTGTTLGKQLLKIKKDFDNLVKINSLKKDFMRGLPNGRYSNFGGTEMRLSN
jgi:hypothetical protein